jgi:hypothetical protein
MPLPIADSLTLTEAAHYIAEAENESLDRARSALVEAGLLAKIVASGCCHRSAHRSLARYFEAPPYPRQAVPAETWGEDKDWQRSRLGRYSAVRIERAAIDHWLGTGKSQPAAAPEPPGGFARGYQQPPTAATHLSAAPRTAMQEAAYKFVMATYPNGIPAGKTNKALAAEYRDLTKGPMSERTMRRALKPPAAG